MSRLRTTFGIVLLAAAPLSALPPSPAQTDESAVLALENHWIEAITRGDTAALGKILDERFVDVTWRGGIRDRAAAMAALSSPDRAKTDQRLEDLRVRFPTRDVAVVTGVNAVAGREPAFSVRVRFTDVFVRTGSEWKAFSAQETLEKSG